MDYYSPTNWHEDPAKALSAEKLGKIERHLEKSGYIAVLHSHFCGAREPTPYAFSDFEQFKEYLASAVKPGDIIEVFPFPESSCLVSGTIANEKGHVPKQGAY